MTIAQTVNGFALTFETDERLFSPRALDPGTLAMLDGMSSVVTATTVAHSPQAAVLTPASASALATAASRAWRANARPWM